MYNLTRDNLLSIITNKGRYPQAIPYLTQIRKRNQAVTQVAIETLREILSKSQYDAKLKLFALRFMKDCFQQGAKNFIVQLDKQILPLIQKIIQDSNQVHNYYTYAQKPYISQQQLKQFKSEVISMFILAQQCILNWATWFQNLSQKHNPYLKIMRQLQQRGIQFPLQSKYFHSSNQTQFVRNYNETFPVNSSVLTNPQQSLIQVSPVFVTKESRYSKKLNIVLLQLQQLNDLRISEEQKKMEIQRISNIFQQVISEYMTSADYFDEKFVNSYYSQLENIIKKIHQNRSNKTDENYLIIPDNQNTNQKSPQQKQIYPENTNNQYNNRSKQQAIFSNQIDVVLRESLHKIIPHTVQLNSFVQKQNQNQFHDNSSINLRLSQTFQVNQSSNTSQISKNSSLHPPFRIPSLTLNPQQDLGQIILTKKEHPVKYDLPNPKLSFEQESKKLPNRQQPRPLQIQESQKFVTFDENKNQKMSYFHFQKQIQPNFKTSDDDYYNTKFANNNQTTSSKSPNPSRKNKIFTPLKYENFKKDSFSIYYNKNLNSYDSAMNCNNQQERSNQQLRKVKSLQKSQTQHKLQRELLKERRQNAHISQNLLFLERKVESLENRIQDNIRHLHKNQFLKNERTRSNGKPSYLSESSHTYIKKKQLCRVDQNFFLQQEYTHNLNIYLKDLLGWANINKFKLAVLGVNHHLFKNQHIKIDTCSKKVINKGSLCLELQIKIVANNTPASSILIKYQSQKQLQVWTKPPEYTPMNNKQITQQIICHTIQSSFPLLQATVTVDKITSRIALPVMLINFLQDGDVSAQKFKIIFREQEKFILKSRILKLNPVTVPSPTSFSNYFHCSYKFTDSHNIFQSGFLHSVSQEILLLQIQMLQNQRAVFRVLQVGSSKRQMGKELMDNLIFLFCI